MPIYTLNLIQYITLIFLSVLTGYTLHGIIDAIKDGTFFDWEQIKKSLQNDQIKQAQT